MIEITDNINTPYVNMCSRLSETNMAPKYCPKPSPIDIVAKFKYPIAFDMSFSCIFERNICIEKLEKIISPKLYKIVNTNMCMLLSNKYLENNNAIDMNIKPNTHKFSLEINVLFK